LSRQPDHKEVKKIHAEILSEDDKEILTKGLTANEMNDRSETFQG